MSLPPLRLVRQRDPAGCMAASLAMVMGVDYAEVVARLHPVHRGAVLSKGLSDVHSDSLLAEYGFAMQKLYRHYHPGACDREAWPPAPWADRHLCQVGSLWSGAPHAVVMRGDGVVLDPDHGEVESLARYPVVWWVAAIFPAASPRAPLHAHDGPGRKHAGICCTCAPAWEGKA